MPRNVAIIMDGNGRWAQEKGLPRNQGHAEGSKTVEKIANDCVDLGFNSLTLYSFSMENWKRPKTEIDALMDLYAKYLVGIRPMMMKNHVRLVHLGRLENLPERVTRELANSIEITAGNDGMILGFALNYSGRIEIIDAAKRIARKCKDGVLDPEDIDERCISENLYCPQIGDPDLLIRTANELRISNFLLWQISYSEFFVTKTYWPDFTKSHLEEAIMTYAKRMRRFGNIEPQPKMSR
ncbi:MAG: di-trans,poly-cis-decaprenylcistransferase [Candidatus Brocadiia bacterium]|nr:MAG: di-trans,poly-cis-decaprenylcistransferase [Candidatus Brocadiia bacterium]